MKLTKGKDGALFLELGPEDPLTLKKGFYGNHLGATVAMGNLERLGEIIPTPLLEDIFFLAQAELQERDSREIEKGVKYE